MEVSIQTDKINKKQTILYNPYQNDNLQSSDEFEKERRIKQLTKLNKELIERLKEQNEDLSKKISKHKFKADRSTSSVKQSKEFKQSKEVQAAKKQLSNAYKQIDMYKSMVANLKGKDISIESIDKINQLENKIKIEQSVIDQLQKEIKYLSAIKNQQEKELKIFQNDEVKNLVVGLEKEASQLKQKIKVLKANKQRREEIQKKQHAYQIELERALRKLNDEYYPGKVQPKKNANQQNSEIIGDISEQQWQKLRAQLAQLRKAHQENQKKIDNIIRQKNKEMKQTEQSNLKIKQKTRKLNTLQNKLTELSKLVTVRERTVQNKESVQQAQGNGQTLFANQRKNKYRYLKEADKEKADKKMEDSREVKQWIPQGFSLEAGKILPGSIFYSDKTVLKTKRNRITQIHIWTNQSQIPCLLQFTYQNQKGNKTSGIQPVPNISSSLQHTAFKMKQGDYLQNIQAYLVEEEMVGFRFISKLGKEFVIQPHNMRDQAEVCTFLASSNQIPSCAFGAYRRNGNQEVRVCHLGFEFVADW